MLCHWKTSRIIAIIIYLLMFPGLLPAQPVLTLTPVITGLSSPMQLVNAGDDRIFIVQREGSILVYDNAYNFLNTFLTVPDITTNGERGLLSMVFHPNYSVNGFFYVYYTNMNGDLELARYHATGNEAEIGSGVILLTIPHPGQSNHNGGELHFGNDGNLYLSTGDGGGGGDQSNNAQNTNQLLGKILRLAVNTSPTPPYYSIPAGNPFGNEVFAVGLRNPFRWSFDSQTNDMWIGDVGQDSWEEINFKASGTIAGSNFGWRCYEGNSVFNTSIGCAGPVTNYVFPVYTYPTQNPTAAITGGTVYRGINEFMQGYYISADFYSGTYYIIGPDGMGGWITTLQENGQTGIVDFGETSNAELYAVSLTANSVFQITSDEALPLVLTEFSGVVRDNRVDLFWKTATEQNVQQFDIELSTDGNNFSRVGIVPAKNSPDGAAYSFQHFNKLNGTVYYRLKMLDIDSRFEYSSIIRLDLPPGQPGSDFIYPTIINNQLLTLYLNEPYTLVELVSSNGRIVLRKTISGQTGSIQIPLPAVPAGIYIVRVTGNKKMIHQKIIIQ